MKHSAKLNIIREWKFESDKKHRLAVVIILTAILFEMTGCTGFTSATRPTEYPAPPAAADLKSAEKGWWYARFKISWPENTEPKWHIDTILAHRVVEPVLERYRDMITLWRFHRRAARDNAGHRFSFIFYSTPAIADQVFDSLERNRELKLMRDNDLINDAIYDNTGIIAKPGIGDTSDKNWTENIQKTWPYFIMGASRMWLHMIDGLSSQTAGQMDVMSVEELQQHYRIIHDYINLQWLEQGNHAILHHINALFGYQPVYVYEKRKMNF